MTRRQRIRQILNHLKLVDETNIDWVVRHLQMLMEIEYLQGQFKGQKDIKDAR